MAVQSAGLAPCSGNCVVTMPGPSAAGDTLLLVVFWQRGPLSPIVDSLGDRFVEVGTRVAGVGSGFFAQSTAQIFASAVVDAGLVSVPLEIDGGALVDAVLVEFSNFAGPGLPESSSAGADFSAAPDGGLISASPGALVFGYVNAGDTLLDPSPAFTAITRFDGDLYVFAAPTAGQDFRFAPVFTHGLAVSWVAGMVSLVPSLPDAGVLDGGALDAGSLDAGSLDAGILDAGSLDAGSLDGGSLDAGSADAGGLDVGRRPTILTVGCQVTASGEPWSLLLVAWCFFQRTSRR